MFGKKALLIIISLYCSSLMAKEAKPLTLPKIDVIGSDKASLFNTSGSADFVTQEQLKEKKPISSQDAIKQVSGVHVVETEGFGLFPRIGMRGLNPDMSRKVLLLEDGAPIQLGPFTEPAAYYMSPIERFESIEVLKGSSSLRYGPSTIGGTLNFVTKAPPKQPGGSLSLSGGSRNTQSAMLEAGGTFDNSAVSVNWLRLGSDGNRENNRLDIDDVVLKFGTALNESHYVGAKLTYFRNRAQATYRGLTQQEFNENHLQNPAEDDFLEVKRLAFDLNHEWEINSDSRIKTLFYSNTADRNWWRQNLDNSDLSLLAGNRGRLRDFTVYGIDSRYQLDYELAGLRHELETGLRLHGERMGNQEVDGAQSNSRSGTIRTDELRGATSIAGFIQNKFRLSERFDITPGVRVESYRQTRDVFRTSSADTSDLGNTNNTEVIPGVGASYRVTNDFQLFAGVHRGFAPPRVQDSINIDGTVTDLNAETSINAEVGGRIINKNMELEFTAFQLDFDNQIVATAESGGASVQPLTNAGSTLHQGFETSSRFSFLNPLFFDFSWTYVPVAKLNSTRIIGGEDRNGNRLTYAPEHVVTFGLGFKKQSWQVRAEYMHVSEQFSDLENTQAGSANGRQGLIPEYGLVNLAGDVRLTEQLEFYASVKNALDERYIASRAPVGIFPGLQRMVFAGLRGSF
jgi:Fe(3+) dicitrate transport protein